MHINACFLSNFWAFLTTKKPWLAHSSPVAYAVGTFNNVIYLLFPSQFPVEALLNMYFECIAHLHNIEYISTHNTGGR